ncbi:MAG TPA: Ig-like domain-containing protein, partial [Longimicrobiales bacterium]|nr:Ig-like domain-containing protein [Longimicrobiales bacterium]
MRWLPVHPLGRHNIVSIFLLFALTITGCGDGAAGPNGPDDSDEVATVAVTPNLVPLVPQQTADLTATVRNAAGNALTGHTVTWTTSASGIVTVTGNGAAATITAVAPGKATITATSEGKSGSATITVNDGGFVGAAGGQVTAANGAVRIQVPTGALSAGTALSVSPVASPPAAT